MKKLIFLCLMILISNIILAQDCRKVKITVLQLDTTSSKSHSCLTFYSSDKLLKQIWWSKSELPQTVFKLGKSYNLKLVKRNDICSFDKNGQVILTYSCYAKDYYVDNIKHEDYEICKGKNIKY